MPGSCKSLDGLSLCFRRLGKGRGRGDENVAVGSRIFEFADLIKQIEAQTWLLDIQRLKLCVGGHNTGNARDFAPVAKIKNQTEQHAKPGADLTTRRRPRAQHALDNRSQPLRSLIRAAYCAEPGCIELASL